MNKQIIINNIRNINKMVFTIPNPGLYILTGKNGSGKTTLFTCLSRICNNSAFRLGFPTAQDNMDKINGSITYIVDDASVEYTKRKNGEWRPSTNLIKVFDLMGYPMVKNITTKNERVFTQDEIKLRNIKSINNDITDILNNIFETDKFSRMYKITTGLLYKGRSKKSADTRRRNIAYAISYDKNAYYTERNFSFGEIVFLNILYDMESIKNGSLVLIDELKLALHPSAQIKLLYYLKKLQKIKD